MLAMINPTLLPAIEAEWRGHLADGLTQLRRTPSSGVRSYCDIIRAEPAQFDLPFLMRMAACELTQEERDRISARSQRYQASDTVPIFLLRGGLAWQIQQASDGAERTRLKKELEALGVAETPKAPAVRKMLFPLLVARFGAKPEKILGSEYRLPLGLAGGVQVSLWLDFGGMSRGVHWKVELDLDHVQRHLRGDSYEGLLGLPMNDWNVLRTDTLPADLDLLVERIALTLDIIRGVSWS